MYTDLKNANWKPYTEYSFSYNKNTECFKAHMYFQEGTGFLFYVKGDGVPRSFSSNIRYYISPQPHNN